MDTAELLAQLADIHLPEPVSFWPPAIGWWILALAIVLLGAFFGRRYYQYYKRRRTCDFALRELNHAYQGYTEQESSGADLDRLKLQFVNQFNAVLRRVALWHFPHSHVASLGGDDWVDFIREKGDSSRLTDEIADALSKGRFQTRCEVDVNALNELGRQWITSLYMGDADAAKPYRSGSSGNGNTRTKERVTVPAKQFYSDNSL